MEKVPPTAMGYKTNYFLAEREGSQAQINEGSRQGRLPKSGYPHLKYHQ